FRSKRRNGWPRACRTGCSKSSTRRARSRSGRMKSWPPTSRNSSGPPGDGSPGARAAAIIPSPLFRGRLSRRSNVTHLIEPHGGVLVDGIVDDERAAELKKQSSDWQSWDLTERQI